ncbi:DUF362 domain-containing protein [Candidatus Woesearchaeota archaeon]|nr:DUF362 domain-containing protein [Candidatus Woesearchaeota archaeon]
MIIRWICEKCNKKWVYPVEKCVYCKGPVTKQKGTQIKVAGITKVTIPSLMHPIIPYNILLLQDEFGNRLPKKTLKDYEIGDTYTERKAEGKGAVAVIKVKYDIYEAIKYSFELLKDIKFDPHDKILIKPSIIAAAYPYQAVNVNPGMLDALIRVLLECGIKKEHIMIAEQSLIGSDVMDACAKAGIKDICKKHGIIFADISKGPFEKIESDGCSFSIYKEALQRKIINVPVMKTNFQLGISGALENLSRLVDEKTQREMYYSGIDSTLPKLAEALKEVITVADATNGMQGQGPLALGEPAFMNLVLASTNPAALDSIFCEMFMIPLPAHVISAGKGIDAKSIEVAGSELDSLKYPIKTANPEETPHPDIKVINGKGCPACLNLMYSLSSKLVGLRGHEMHLLVGSQFDKSALEKQRIVAVGDCAVKKIGELKLDTIAKIPENVDEIEQLVLLKKLLITEGAPKITPVDKVKSKMAKLISKVMG